MPAPNPLEEWQRLSALYAQKGDGELLQLRDAFDDLTQTAQTTLRDELRKRNLWSVQMPIGSESPEAELSTEDIPEAELMDVIRVGGVTVYESDDRNDAGLIWYVLTQADIKAALTRKENDWDFRLPQVKVRPEDVEKALAVIAKPIAESVRFAYEEESKKESEDFVPPKCATCGNADPLLESVEPTNIWLCEKCGARWSDALHDG